MSAEQFSNGQTFVVPADAPEAPRTSRLGGQPNPHYPPEVESAQLQQVAAAQKEHPVEELDEAEVSEVSDQEATAAPQEDVERLLPNPNDPFTLADGTRVTARHLKLREFLSMIKIVTRGASMAMGTVPLNVNDANFQQSLIMLFIFAIPEAPDESAEFVRQIIDPAPPEGGWKSPEEEVAVSAHLDELMLNPDLDDLISVIETVIRKEGPDIRRLGKRLTDAMTLAQKVAPKSS